MVDALGNQAVNRVATAAPVAPVQPTAPVRAATPAAAEATDTAQAGGVARTMAQSAPVDADRVQRIKRAIAEGKFPILPATIADRLLALKLQWNPNEDTPHDPA